MDKKRRFYLTIVIILLTPLACSLADISLNIPIFSEDNCTYTAPRQVEIEARDVQRIRILAGAGTLQVTGKDDTAKIIVDGMTCASAESLLEIITLTAEQQGDEIIIQANQPPPAPAQITNLDLTLEVPRNIPLDIEDTGGPLVVSLHHADIHLADGSGSIELQDINGDVTIAQDGAGPITMRQINGDIVIKQDGAGDIIITGVQGNVTIGRDGAGDINVSNITGDLTVDSDGSGDISHANIGGKVQLP